MIRADVANRLQPAADIALRPAPPAQEITDKLSGLVAGQRLLAEIQSLMPNGSYRALINQRNVTLALPFAAKSGDTIELEVTESDGKLTLAVVATAGSESGRDEDGSAATSLSRTGQLISNLLGGPRDGKGGPVALPLNGNQPISTSPPTDAQELLPLLKQAITTSGMFYESHQAEWVEGRYSKEQLLQEPQGKLAPQTPLPQLQQPSTIGDTSVISGSPADTAPVVAKTPEANTGAAQPSQAVAAQAQSLVQQQLEAFATQNFSWQGQVWPGQQMQWEIETDNERQQSSGDDDSQKWQTRLRLTLPRLGEVEARLHVQGQQLTLAMRATSAETRELLRGGTATLRSQLEQAGLDLASLGVASPQEIQADIQFAE
ncbi:MAG: flagellar hook-length control protein FliK [Candidatus Accumulibacter sp.]|jgi:flagellar hook-length control protein FliK|uniref:flagellar hook-length control protein FliK n=1 Tax=Accumulibacter sp. TaxID=2053492 RepID=UPI001AC8DB64|nr:flagellar hook-length control protein FliK [Accumulibacter sp.]MBN8437807.1 flagellar hook-length control protein FliK [Accumulibacter sp.]